MAVNLDPLLEGASFEELIKAQTDKALLVRFAIDCARRVQEKLLSSEIDCLRAAEQWLLHPCDETAEAAFDFYYKAPSGSMDVVAYLPKAKNTAGIVIMVMLRAASNDSEECEWQLQRFMEIFCGS